MFQYPVVEEQRMKNKALACRDEDEKEQTEDVPVIAPQGRGGDDLHEVDSNNRLSYAGETSESADIEGRSRLAIMLRGQLNQLSFILMHKMAEV